MRDWGEVDTSRGICDGAASEVESKPRAWDPGSLFQGSPGTMGFVGMSVLTNAACFVAQYLVQSRQSINIC